jgi:hypothetical protein
MWVAIGLAAAITLGIFGIPTEGAGAQPGPAGTCPSRVKAAGGVGVAEPPTRVLVIGDSLIYQASCAAARAMAGSNVTTFLRAAPGTGLLGGNVDWVARAAMLVRKLHPDVVVAEFVGDYLRPVAGPDGQLIQYGSPAFFAAWQDRASSLSTELRRAGASVYWVEPPPQVSPVATAGALRLFAGYRRLGDHTLDAGRSLAGPHGDYLPVGQSCAAGQTLRTPDGLHLAPAGARVFGLMVARELTRALGLPIVPNPC